MNINELLILAEDYSYLEPSLTETESGEIVPGTSFYVFSKETLIQYLKAIKESDNKGDPDSVYLQSRCRGDKD